MTMGGSGINVIGGGHFGDTTLTKVFVGGLAWETPKEAMREHFDKYGDILEAVIISDKLTGRSKGYGFVTFKDPEGAKRACEDAAPIINGRRANCNLASLGARRPKQSTTPPPPPQQGPNNIGVGGGRSMAANNQVQWYYPGGTPQLTYPPQQHHHQAVPYYGYSPATYITPEINYNHKMSYTRGGGGGAYMNAGQYYPHHHHQVYPSHQTIVGANTMMPMYPVYQYHHHSPTMGLPAHMYPATTTTGPVPALISKPPSLVAPPTETVCLSVE